MSFIKFIQFLAVQHISGPINSIVYSFSQSCTTSNSQMVLLLCWIVALRIVRLHSTVSPSTRFSRARRMWRVDVERSNRVFHEFYCNAWSSILHIHQYYTCSIIMLYVSLMLFLRIMRNETDIPWMMGMFLVLFRSWLQLWRAQNTYGIMAVWSFSYHLFNDTSMQFFFYDDVIENHCVSIWMCVDYFGNVAESGKFYFKPLLEFRPL